jgi:hypothetical protein
MRPGHSLIHRVRALGSPPLDRRTCVQSRGRPMDHCCQRAPGLHRQKGTCGARRGLSTKPYTANHACALGLSYYLISAVSRTILRIGRCLSLRLYGSSPSAPKRILRCLALQKFAHELLRVARAPFPVAQRAPRGTSGVQRWAPSDAMCKLWGPGPRVATMSGAKPLTHGGVPWTWKNSV